MNCILTLHDGSAVKCILTVPAKSITSTHWQQFDAPTREAAEAECTKRGLVLAITPGQKQLILFNAASGAVKTKWGPLLKAVAALNDSDNEEGAKTFLTNLGPTTAEETKLQAALVACYP